MIENIFTELVAGAIGTVLGWIGFKFWAQYRARFVQVHTKFTYYRVIRLRFRDRDDAPFYSRDHHTIPNLVEDVFDETLVLNGSHTNIARRLEPIVLTSSGVVDALQILPVLDKDADNHPHTRDEAKRFTFSHDHPSNTLAAIGTIANGLQVPSEWWFGTTAQYDNQTLILVVDFSSLPFDACPVQHVETLLERARGVIPKSRVESQWFEEHLGGDLFYVKFADARKGDVIRVTFEIDKDKVPRKRIRRTGQTKAT
jgi:hypothetical protein